MDERTMMIGEWLAGEIPVSVLARKYGVSRKTAYKWIARHAQGSWKALADRSRAARHHPNAVDGEVERALLELKARWPLWGASKLRCKLLDSEGKERCPAQSTVSGILRRHGLHPEGAMLLWQRAFRSLHPFPEIREPCRVDRLSNPFP